MNTGQTFFKCISSSEKLVIPPAVVSQMQGALAHRLILRDRYDNLWPVEVDKNGDEWSFKKGWPKFYEDNSLEPDNILVFDYKGGNLFDFKLLGGNACEKKGVGAPKFRVKEEEVEEYKGEEEEDQEDLNEDNKEYKDDDDDDDEDYVQEEEESEEEERVNIAKKTKSKNKSKSSHMCNRNLSRIDTFGVETLPFKHKYNKRNITEKKGLKAPMWKVKEEEEEEEVEDEKEREESADRDEDDQKDEHEMDMQMEDSYDEEEEQVNISKINKLNSKSKSSPTLTNGIGTKRRERSNKKKYVPNCYGADIFKLGLATRPKNHPFFVSRSRTSRKNELLIPKDVIIDYKLEIPEKMFLIDERGSRWETKVKRWKDGRLWCTGGWKSLCNVNNIDKDDTCICEFVKEEGCKDLYMLVRVVDGAGEQASL